MQPHNSACLCNTLDYFQIFQRCGERGKEKAKEHHWQTKMPGAPPPHPQKGLRTEKRFAGNPADLQGYPIVYIDITLLEATKPLQTNQPGQEGEETSS